MEEEKKVEKRGQAGYNWAYRGSRVREGTITKEGKEKTGEGKRKSKR